MRSGSGEAKQREWEERRQRLQENAEATEPHVRAAEQEAQTLTDWRAAREQLKAVQQGIRETELSREDRQAFFDRMNAAFETLSRRQTEARQQYERECAENLRYVQTKVSRACELANYGNDFREAFDALRDAQQSLRETRPLRREDREPLFSSLERGFEILNRRREEYRRQKQREFEERQRERERKRQEWKDRQRQRISNLEGAISRLRDSIARDSDHLENLKRKRDQVRPGRKANEIYAALNKKMEEVAARRWDKHTKVSDIEKELSRLKDELSRS